MTELFVVASALKYSGIAGLSVVGDQCRPTPIDPLRFRHPHFLS